MDDGFVEAAGVLADEDASGDNLGDRIDADVDFIFVPLEAGVSFSIEDGQNFGIGLGWGATLEAAEVDDKTGDVPGSPNLEAAYGMGGEAVIKCAWAEVCNFFGKHGKDWGEGSGACGESSYEGSSA